MVGAESHAVFRVSKGGTNYVPSQVSLMLASNVCAVGRG